jgi:hypothetical protein
MVTIDQAVQAVRLYLLSFDPFARFEPRSRVTLEGSVYWVVIKRKGTGCTELYSVDAETGHVMPERI